ncbi:MAG TPA: hypothetical protein DIV86_01245 [Alphaproteobacteria bacterium]|nr:hypothetical protein [Alphaproteobacteria bacterium]
MTLAGYDPEASEKIWQKIYNRSGNNGQMITTHPISSDRMLKNRDTILIAKKYYIPGQKNPNFEYVLRNNDIVGQSNLGQALASLTSGGQQAYQQNNYGPENSMAAAPQSMGSGIQAGAGAGALAVAETFMNYYKDKKEAKKIASSELARVSTLKQIQENMQITGGKRNSDGSFAMEIKYNGLKPVQNLSVKAVTQTTESLYRHNGIITPGQTYNAIFGKELFENIGEKPKMKLLVDEGSYLN